MRLDGVGQSNDIDNIVSARPSSKLARAKGRRAYARALAAGLLAAQYIANDCFLPFCLRDRHALINSKLFRPAADPLADLLGRARAPKAN